MSLRKHFFTSESVGEGHPDKVCDQISDGVLDDVLRQDSYGRVACETYVTMGLLIVGGEITTSGYVDVHNLTRNILKEIGYTHPKYGFDYHTCAVINTIHSQSPDIALGVNKGGAGDQGFVTGYACEETPELMPLPIMLAHKLVRRIAEVRRKGILKYLGPDCKSQVTVEYHDGHPKRMDSCVLACQHTEEILDSTKEKITKAARHELIDVIAKPVLKEYIDKETKYYVNETGKFVIGGPQSDTGMCLTEKAFVSTDEGLISIRDLKEKMGIGIYTDKEKGKLIDWIENGEREALRFITRGGFEIEATPNHPFRTIEDGEYKWKEARDLTLGDYLVFKQTPLSKKYIKLSSFKFISQNKKFYKDSKIPKYLNKDLSYLIGYLIGDGTTSESNLIKLHFGSEEEREHLIKKTKILGKVQAYYDGKDRNSGRVQFNSIKFRKLLEYLGLTYEYQNAKRVPCSIFQSPSEIIKAFLRGYFDADGGIFPKQGRKRNRFQIACVSTSKQLLLDIKLLLFHLGINSKIHLHRKKKFSHFSKKIGLVKDASLTYRLRIIGNESINKFLRGIGFELKRKQAVYKEQLDSLPKDGTYRLGLPNVGKIVERILKLNPYLADKYHLRQLVDKRAKKSGRYNRLTLKKTEEILRVYKDYSDNADYKKLNYLADLDLYFDKIVRIKKAKGLTYDITINPTHTFVANGIVVHNTGRKIIVDTYGGVVAPGGGAFSGKDPTKVDRSAAYMTRYIAKNIVAAGLADKCLIQLAYVIGRAEPLAIMVDTFGTGKLSENAFIKLIGENFELTPQGMIKALDLLRPIYRKTACYGHFGRLEPEFSWEITDKVATLKRQASRL